jgi:xanthine phosphoribosyltransferase
MQALVQRIKSDGKSLGGGILKVDSFLNHQLEPALTLEMGRAFAQAFSTLKIAKIVTAEVSGIAPALATAVSLGVPMLYARKRRPLTMTGVVLEAEAPSRTKGGVNRLVLSPDYLKPAERVLIIDDFLASGHTIAALAEMVRAGGAELCGIGCVIEKAFEGGRARLEGLEVPIVALAVVERLDESGIVVRSGV